MEHANDRINWKIPGFSFNRKDRKVLFGKKSSIIFLRHNGMENEKDVVAWNWKIQKLPRVVMFVAAADVDEVVDLGGGRWGDLL